MTLNSPLLAADHDAHPVAVRVGTQDEVRPHLVGQVNGQIEALGVLRIGGGHRGEIAVQHHLLLDAVQVLHAQAPQGLRYQLPAAAVEGGINDPELIGSIDFCHFDQGMIEDKRIIPKFYP